MRRIGWGVGLLALALILGVYVQRIFMALPIYAGDEGAYLIRALFSHADAARNPHAADVNNTVFFLVIRAVHLLGEDYVAWLRAVGLAAYLGGLLLVWRVSMDDVPRRDRWAFLLLACAFPYYRFVVTALPEGLFVGVLGLIVWLTARQFRMQPLRHALLSGALTAVLLLIKPHGLAVAAGLIALMVLDVVWRLGGGWKKLIVRLCAFLLAFISVGAFIQVLAGQPSQSALTFFIGDFYGRTLGQARAPQAGEMGLLSFIGMLSTTLLLAGPVLVIAKVSILKRRMTMRGPLAMLQTQELVFLLLALCLAATIAMVTIFTMQIAAAESEMRRIWGRYFEFYMPMLWLAGASFVVRLEARPRRAILIGGACATLAGLAGLLFCFRQDVVLFPWDCTAIFAFFKPHPVRAALGAMLPYREAAVAATLVAAMLLVIWRRPSRIWVGYFLALGLLSTDLDRRWIGVMIKQRTELDAQMTAASAFVPRAPGGSVMIVPDNNFSQLGFLAFNGAPVVIVQPPGTPIPADTIGAFTVLTIGAPAPPPGAGWKTSYEASMVQVFSRDSGAR